MKFCKDCKHYQHLSKSYYSGPIIVKRCLMNPMHDLVSGEPEYRFASVERSIIDASNHCSKEGKWFEVKTVEDADLDDLSTIPFGK